ncbi:nucleotide exchange factor GrpE [Candidatus Woesearchaeota archaeon]|nr:nucleotide exchange factor GrpE [Candidatus Woesearchaeota archaeon]
MEHGHRNGQDDKGRGHDSRHGHDGTAKLKEQLAEMTDTAKRIQAEFENYKRREEANRAEYLKSCNRELMLKLVPVLENLDLSLRNKDNENEFRKGVELIVRQLKGILAAEGLEEIGAAGQRFDPNLHEAVSTKEGEKDGTVLEEVSKGYTLHGKVVRHAKVVVGTKG